jgi:hypothetical protein
VLPRSDADETLIDGTFGVLRPLSVTVSREAPICTSDMFAGLVSRVGGDSSASSSEPEVRRRALARLRLRYVKNSPVAKIIQARPRKLPTTAPVTVELVGVVGEDELADVEGKAEDVCGVVALVFECVAELVGTPVDSVALAS